MKASLCTLMTISFCIPVQSQPADTLFLNAGWQPGKEKKAKYIRIIQHVNDTLCNVTEFDSDYKILMTGEYFKKDSLIENGRFAFYDQDSQKIKAYGNYTFGMMTGIWTYFDQSGDSTQYNYDFELISNSDPGYMPDTFTEPAPPSFNGADNSLKAFGEYIRLNQVFPAMQKLHNIDGKVLIRFSINTEGKVTDIKAVRPENKDFEREAVRVVAGSPDWTPGHYGDKLTTTMYTIPVYFEQKR